MLSSKLKETLISAAKKYETSDFIAADPVQFPHRYTRKADIEIAGLLTALISFGNRKQILAKADLLCNEMGESPLNYIVQRKYATRFRASDATSFYRMISHAAFLEYLEKLHAVYAYGGDLEAYIGRFSGNPMEKMCAFLGVSPKSPQKKINMFLRWMVRENSAVDFGIWKSLGSENLIIPLDTHVVHVAKVLGITEKETYSLNSAMQITRTLSKVFPGDPVRGDFALFGLGVEREI